MGVKREIAIIFYWKFKINFQMENASNILNYMFFYFLIFSV